MPQRDPRLNAETRKDLGGAGQWCMTATVYVTFSQVTTSRWTFCHIGQIVSIVEKSPFVKAFGKRILALREEMELTQEELAHLAGLDRTAITLIERARRSSTLDTIEKLARALKAQPADLMPPIKLKR